MSPPPIDHWQFRAIEHRYSRGKTQGWYKGDVGKIASFTDVPIWIFCTWSPMDSGLIGSASREYIILVDNTFVSSFAFNLTKIELASQMLNTEEDFSQLMEGNIKKFVAEQSYFHSKNENNIQWLIEYLYEFNKRNRTLDRRIREKENGGKFLSVLAGCSSFCLLLHELGHVAYLNEEFRGKQIARIDNSISKKIGKRHKFDRLREEVFCDVFAIYNTISVFNQEDGWDAKDILNICLHSILGAHLCIMTHQTVTMEITGGPEITLDPETNIQLARYEVAKDIMEQIIEESYSQYRTSRIKIPFNGDTLGLLERWYSALAMEVVDDEVRNLSQILSKAFYDQDVGGFDYVVEKLNSLTPLREI